MKNLKLLAILVATSLLFGCASGAKIENMVYTPADEQRFDSSLNKQVDVASVLGGETTNPAWTSEISNEDFSAAVEQSLSAQGLFGENGRYQLQITLLEVDQPLFGMDFEVVSHIKYVLTDSNTKEMLFDETIIAPYTATIGDAFVAIKRLRLANEGSGRKNIEGLMNKLSQLEISPKQVSIVK